MVPVVMLLHFIHCMSKCSLHLLLGDLATMQRHLLPPQLMSLWVLLPGMGVAQCWAQMESAKWPHGLCCYMKIWWKGASLSNCLVVGFWKPRDRPLSLGSCALFNHWFVCSKMWRGLISLWGGPWVCGRSWIQRQVHSHWSPLLDVHNDARHVWEIDRLLWWSPGWQLQAWHGSS